MTSTAAYGFFGDDFTGATDTLAHLARAGLRTVLFLRVPDPAMLAHAGPLDAVGIAGATRAASPDVIRETLTDVAECMTSLGVRLMHYKVCSTFDSAPRVGNIASAVAALRERFDNPLVAIVGGQPNLQRYCVFSQLFAAADGMVSRIDRHPTMAHHPVTPMGEADLRVHLAAQGLSGVVGIDWRRYDDAGHLAAAVVDALTQAAPAVLFDVLTDAHLQAIGRVLHNAAEVRPMIAVGPSSVAQAWGGAGEGSMPMALDGLDGFDAPDGPVLVLAGSLSPITARQIDRARHYERIALDPALLTGTSGAAYIDDRGRRIAAALQAGRHVLTYTLRPTADMTQPKPSGAAIAKACAALLTGVLEQHAVKRLGIAGGDTSSFAMQALPAWGLTYAGSLPYGVTVCRLRADTPSLDGMEVILKGGQMGAPELFDQLAGGASA